jgi:hypothetical protein
MGVLYLGPFGRTDYRSGCELFTATAGLVFGGFTAEGDFFVFVGAMCLVLGAYAIAPTLWLIHISTDRFEIWGWNLCTGSDFFSFVALARRVFAKAE